MNKQESDVLNSVMHSPSANQRILAEISGHSLGVVNRSVRELIKDGYLDRNMCPTAKAVTEYKQNMPRCAVILAAGFGMRMVPLNAEIPKGLLEINKEPLIERTINQLHEVGINEIYVVVGLGQFTRNYTQTVKRAADNKRRYAPGWVHSTCLLRGFPKGAAPHLAHDFAEQSVVCYTLCRRCPENAVAAGEGKGI